MINLQSDYNSFYSFFIKDNDFERMYINLKPLKDLINNEIPHNDLKLFIGDARYLPLVFGLEHSFFDERLIVINFFNQEYKYLNKGLKIKNLDFSDFDESFLDEHFDHIIIWDFYQQFFNYVMPLINAYFSLKINGKIYLSFNEDGNLVISRLLNKIGFKNLTVKNKIFYAQKIEINNKDEILKRILGVK